MRVVGERQQGVEVLVHERADLAVGEAFRGRVDRQDEALVRAFFPRVREQDELPRHELAPVVVADGPGDEQQLAPLDGALEEGLARPGALDEPALVPQDRAEYAQPAARGDHPGADDTPHAGHLLAHARLRERRDPRGIEIAVRGVVQEIAHRPNAEPRERLGPLGPDALQVLDRRPERQIHHPSPFPLFPLFTGLRRPLGKPLPPPPRPLDRERGDRHDVQPPAIAQPDPHEPRRGRALVRPHHRLSRAPLIRVRLPRAEPALAAPPPPPPPRPGAGAPPRGGGAPPPPPPPRNTQRYKPVADSVARRTPSRTSSRTIGRCAPRRASRALSATSPDVSRPGATPVAAVAGGTESQGMPTSAAATGDGGGGSTYQSPATPPTVGHESREGGAARRSPGVGSRGGSPTATTSRAAAVLRAKSAGETGASVAASRQRPGSVATNVFTGTRATSASVRDRKRVSQSGGAASITIAGAGLTSTTNRRASSRGSSSPTSSNRTSRVDQPAGERPGGAPETPGERGGGRADTFGAAAAAGTAHRTH